MYCVVWYNILYWVLISSTWYNIFCQIKILSFRGWYGCQGWHKDLSLGQQITKTIVINVGSKERDNEETTGSFDNDVSFKVDNWKGIEKCALGLGGLNSEDELHQDEWKPAAILTKNPSAT